MTKFRILTLVIGAALSLGFSAGLQAQSKKTKKIVKKVKKKTDRRRNLVIEKTYKIKKGKEKRILI